MNEGKSKMTEEEDRSCYYCGQVCHSIDSLYFKRKMMIGSEWKYKYRHHHNKCVIGRLLRLENFEERIQAICREDD